MSEKDRRLKVSKESTFDWLAESAFDGIQSTVIHILNRLFLKKKIKLKRGIHAQLIENVKVMWRVPTLQIIINK